MKALKNSAEGASKIHPLLGTLSPVQMKVLRFTDALSNALPLKYG